MGTAGANVGIVECFINSTGLTHQSLFTGFGSITTCVKQKSHTGVCGPRRSFVKTHKPFQVMPLDLFGLGEHKKNSEGVIHESCQSVGASGNIVKWGRITIIHSFFKSSPSAETRDSFMVIPFFSLSMYVCSTDTFVFSVQDITSGSSC